jgi:transposase InsO family protein
VALLARSDAAKDVEVSPAFDAVFSGTDTRIIRTPVRATQANAIAERFIGTLRRECNRARGVRAALAWAMRTSCGRGGCHQTAPHHPRRSSPIKISQIVLSHDSTNVSGHYT